VLLSAVVASVLATSPARADDAQWLEWSPPPECPTREYILQRIEEWLGGALPNDAGLAVDTSLEWTGSSWQVNVRVSFDGHTGQRSVAVTGCSEAADFVAVAVVLAVDPSLADTLPMEGRATEDETSSPIAEAEAPPSDDALAPVATRSQPTAQPAAKPSSNAPPTWSPRPFVVGAGEALLGSLPELQFGVGVGGGIELDRVLIGASGHFLPPSQVAPSEAAAPIDFGLITGRAAISYLWPLSTRIGLGPRVSLEAGAVFTEQKTQSPVRTTEPWVTGALGASWFAAISGQVHFIAELDLVIPFTQPAFVLRDDSPVHQVGLGGRLDLGIRVFFTER